VPAGVDKDTLTRGAAEVVFVSAANAAVIALGELDVGIVVGLISVIIPSMFQVQQEVHTACETEWRAVWRLPCWICTRIPEEVRPIRAQVCLRAHVFGSGNVQRTTSGFVT
jgi:hypothetical protein